MKKKSIYIFKVLFHETFIQFPLILIHNHSCSKGHVRVIKSYTGSSLNVRSKFQIPPLVDSSSPSVSKYQQSSLVVITKWIRECEGIKRRLLLVLCWINQGENGCIILYIT